MEKFLNDNIDKLLVRLVKKNKREKNLQINAITDEQIDI